jgi:segregation and condensation protein B
MLMRDGIKAAVEAILFISGERVGKQELMELLNLTEEELTQIMREMIVEYNQVQRGIQILAMDGGYIMGTKPEYTNVISRMGKVPNRRLSTAALETLAIIAYRQPLSKAEIEFNYMSLV